MPLLVALLLVARPTALGGWAGLAVVALGEGIRITAVRYIGPVSRTRGSEVGALALGGPYRRSRNPLYVANLVLYLGVALASAHWLGLVVLGAMCLHYHWVVSWEERRLLASHGDDYRAYLRRVPRWLGWRATGPAMPPRSERSTLLVTGIVLLSLLFKGWSTAGG